MSTVTTLSLNNKVCFSETLKSLSDAKASSCLPRSWRTITEPYFLIRSASKVAKRSFEQFAINYVQIGLNGACCNGSPQALRSWWGYDAPILAATAGLVVEVVDGIPDQQPVGTLSNVTAATAGGNSVIEDIGGGRYVAYGHLKPGTIPAWVRKGTRLRTGDLIGRLGNSGNSDVPHLHFQVMDGPSFLDATGLPFVFDSQLLEGRVSETAAEELGGGAFVPIDRRGAGLQRNLMPEGNGVFGYNLSH